MFQRGFKCCFVADARTQLLLHVSSLSSTPKGRPNSTAKQAIIPGRHHTPSLHFAHLNASTTNYIRNLKLPRFLLSKEPPRVILPPVANRAKSPRHLDPTVILPLRRSRFPVLRHSSQAPLISRVDPRTMNNPRRDARMSFPPTQLASYAHPRSCITRNYLFLLSPAPL